MEKKFCIDLTYGYNQYPIALINESIDEVNRLEGKTIYNKIAANVKTAKIEVSKIIEYLPKDFMIEHIIGEHSGQCDIFDLYTHYFDGYILGYGNNEAALLFKHYEIAPSPKEPMFPFSEERYLSKNEVDWIELNIRKRTKENLIMLSKLCNYIQKLYNKKIIVYNCSKNESKENSFYDLKSIIELASE